MRIFCFSVTCFYVLGLLSLMRAHAAGLHYTASDELYMPGPTRWDYLTFDTSHHELFITRGDGIDVLDTQTKVVVGKIENLEGTHGVALAPSLSEGFVTEGKANRVTVFDLNSFKIMATVQTGNKPDAIVYDEATHHIFVADGESVDLTVINPLTHIVIGRLPLGSQPEFVVVDSKGYLYVNLVEKSQIAVADTKKLKVTDHYNLMPGCEGPTGLAMDKIHDRLFSTCANKHMLIVEARTGRILDTLPIGQYSDAALFDAQTGLVFSSNGDGTLTVIGLDGGGHYKVFQTVSTKLLARTMALDPLTHDIYLAAADTEGMDPPTEQHLEPRPHIKPDTFEILKVSMSH